MLHKIVFRIENVELGESRNWLEFSIRVGALDQNKKYTIRFCGTELHHGLSITDDEAEILREYLYQDFGFPPFNINTARQVLGKGKDYTIIRGSEGDNQNDIHM